MKPGGTDGGVWTFFIGCGLSVVAAWLFFDSVRVVSGGAGLVTGMMHGRRGGGMGMTTSMGILFVPFVIGLVALFYDARLKWGWVLFVVGLLIIVVEMLSRLRFQFNLKSTHLILLIVMFCAGAGLVLRSLRAGGAKRAIDQMRGAGQDDSGGGDGD